MKELERRAMLGDKQAQKECTEKGIALPCQLCGFPADLILFGTAVKHIREGCVLDHMVASLAEWNNRPKPPTERCKDCRRWMSYSGKSKYRDCQLSEDGLSCRFTPIVNEKTRLIDAENYKEALRNLPNSATKEDAIALLNLMPTVDPETLPIIVNLKQSLDKVTKERDELLNEQDLTIKSLSSLNERFEEMLKELGIEGCEKDG